MKRVSLALSKKRARFALLFFIALTSRLFYIFRFGGHDASDGMMRSGRACIANWKYVPERPPGAPVYDCAIGLIDRIFGKPGLDYYSYTNLFNVLCTTATLFLLYGLVRKHFSEGKTWLFLLALNFYPHFWIMGGSTTDMNFLLLFGVLAFHLFEKNQKTAALAVSALMIGSRIQGLAFSLPLLALCMWQERKNAAKAFQYAAVFLIGHLVVMIPAFQTYGLNVFAQPYHHDFGAHLKFGAFLLRFGNMFGPIGLILLSLLLFSHRKAFLKSVSKNTSTLLVVSSCVLTIGVFFKAPWETFYLLPLVPPFFFFVLKEAKTKTFIALFFLSAFLPNIVQLQFKPWKWPCFEVHVGVLKAHLGQQYILRGGG